MSQDNKTAIDSIFEAIHGDSSNPNSNAVNAAAKNKALHELSERQTYRNAVSQQVKRHRTTYSNYQTKQAASDLEENQAALLIYNKNMTTVFSSWPHLPIPSTATGKQSFLPSPDSPQITTTKHGNGTAAAVASSAADPNKSTNDQDHHLSARTAVGVASNHPSPSASNHHENGHDDDGTHNNKKHKEHHTNLNNNNINNNAIATASTKIEVMYVKQKGGVTDTHYRFNNTTAAVPRPISLESYNIPGHHTIPPYKSWIAVKRNVLALEVGQRMFYSVGNDGETVPVSDDEDNGDGSNDEGPVRDDRVLNGIQRSKNDYIIKNVVKELGCSPLILEPLAEILGATTVAVQQRALELVPEAFTEKQVPPELQKHFNSWDSKKDSIKSITADFHTGFCRRCYTFGCRIHPGPQVRPILGPIKAPKRQRRVLLDGSALPCGSTCFKTVLPPDELAAAIATASKQRKGRKEDDSETEEDEEEEEDKDDEDDDKEMEEEGDGHAPMKVDNQHQSNVDDTADTKKSKSLEAPSSNPKLTKSDKGKEPADSSPASAGWTSAIATQPSTNQFSSAKNNNNNNNQTQQRQPQAPWSEWEDGLVKQGVEIWGRHPCHIATLLGPCSNIISNNDALSLRTCTDVYKRLIALGLDPAMEDENEDDHDKYSIRGKRPHSKPKHTKGYSKSLANERINRNPNEKLPQYYPCNCEGTACSTQCPCRGDVNFCEKYCGCDPKICGNRFPGCRCKGVRQYYGRCSTRACPCRAAGRECDPDLCRLCMPTLNGTHQPNHQCNNLKLRLSQGKRILMGLSNIQGWGAFIGEPALKGDFIGEYTGELIDHIEADRRGKVYDRDDSSYLFDLNLDWVIDGKPKGNKMRFSNHSKIANCRAEIMMVDGDHRVAIFANRDLEAGEELEYDYHYGEQVAPAWAHGDKKKKKREAEGKGPAKKRQGDKDGGVRRRRRNRRRSHDDHDSDDDDDDDDDDSDDDDDADDR